MVTIFTKERNQTVSQASIDPLRSSLLLLTQIPDQSNELNPDFDQFGDEFNWDEDFGGDFDGEYDEFESQGDAETKLPDSQEHVSGGGSKRGFDEVDSDTADEEETPGGVSPSKQFRIPRFPLVLILAPSRFKAEEGAVVGVCAERVPFGTCMPRTNLPPFHSRLFPPPTTDSRSSISPSSHHKLLHPRIACGEGVSGMNSLLTFLGFYFWDKFHVLGH